MGLSDEIRSIIAELPAGATLRTTPNREVARKPAAPKTLSEIMDSYRKQLPRSHVTNELVQQLRRESELGTAVKSYIEALFGGE